MKKRPYPVQKLMADEMEYAEEELGGELRDLEDDVQCDCLFYLKYQLLCRHIWNWHLCYGYLKQQQFEEWIRMWEDDECGYDVYFGMTTQWYQKEAEDEIGAPQRLRLKVRDCLSELHQRFYDLEEGVKALPPEEAEEALQTWLYLLYKVTGPVRKAAVSELTEKLNEKVAIPQKAASQWRDDTLPPSTAVSAYCRQLTPPPAEPAAQPEAEPSPPPATPPPASPSVRTTPSPSSQIR